MPSHSEVPREPRRASPHGEGESRKLLSNRLLITELIFCHLTIRLKNEVERFSEVLTPTLQRSRLGVHARKLFYVAHIPRSASNNDCRKLWDHRCSFATRPV